MKRLIVPAIFLLTASGSAAATLIDFHTHSRSTAAPGDPYHFDHLLKSMTDSGVDQAVLLSSGYLFSEQKREATEQENNFVAIQAKLYPDRIIPFCGVPIRASWA